MRGRWCWMICACLAGAGCASRASLLTLETQNRALSEQTKAHLAEIANLKTHASKLEDQLIAAEQQLAGVQPPAARQPTSTQPHTGLVAAPAGQSTSAERLRQLAAQHRGWRFDPHTGACKLDHDILFDSGDTRLSSHAQRQLSEFAEILLSPAGRGLRVMVVGHTDDRPIHAGNNRQQYSDNWQLAAGRALMVAEFLTAQGVREEQLGLANFGAQQPLAPNADDVQRRLNRRVEVFILGDDVPIVGWTESAKRR